MIVRKIDDTMCEGDLNFIGIMALNHLCHSASLERIEYLIKYYNQDASHIYSLEDYEVCYLVNYVAKGRVQCVNDRGYALYENGKGKRMVLSKEDIESGHYSVFEDRNVDSMKPSEKVDFINKIIDDLEKEGFKILDTNDCILAFCEDRNIVFYAPSLDYALRYYGSPTSCFYRQPYPSIFKNDTAAIGLFSSVDECFKDKVDFPVFSEFRYLFLYNRLTDKETVFNSSMRRIARYPELYNAVGEENQKIIDKVVQSEPEEIEKLNNNGFTSILTRKK